MTAYLDHNATTPLKPEVISAMAACLGQVGNASSVHSHGRQAKKQIESAREQIATLVNARGSEVVFTSGGAEANNLALMGGSLAADIEHLVVSGIEHDSVLKCAAKSAIQTTICPVTRDGVVDVEHLQDITEGISKAGQSALVSVMMANNETGVVQPLSEIVSLARNTGALVHCDAVQGLGKLPIDFTALDVDFLSLSAHKIGGPQGIGALILKSGRGLAPQILGGGQEANRRAGTENLSGIVGFGVAANSVLSEGRLEISELRDLLEQSVSAIAPEAIIFGQNATRLSNTSCFAVEELSAETQVMAMDLAGVAISAGSACSSGKVAPSHVLRAMGANDTVAASAIRVSLGWNTVREDVDKFILAWTSHYQTAAQRSKQMKAAS